MLKIPGLFFRSKLRLTTFAFINANGENENYWFAKHLEEYIPSVVENQTRWLIESGFVNIAFTSAMLILQFSVEVSQK
ncbi:MAG: hypothetical protein SWZ49_17355 [Cyanobacteriota bacterium]|nr:hypothetical protein [Cyanobacteriota bacterium]